MTAASWRESHRDESRGRKRILLGLLALIGVVGVLAWVIHAADADDIVDEFATLGWAIGFVILIHIVVIACDGIAWHALLRARPSAALLDFIWARWVREATNLLLPVAQIGGEVGGARILALRGLPAEAAGGSVILDKLAEALSQIPFTLMGLGLVLAMYGDSQLIRTIALALAVGIVGITAVVLARHADWLRAAARRLAAGVARSGRPIYRRLERFLRAMHAIYAPDRFAAAACWHLLGWIVGTGEVWLALALMGQPISPAAALALESLGQTITALGFMVPAALGVQEGAYVAVGAVLGLPLETALALSLVKRVRQIVVGVPALCSWQILELRQLLAAAVVGIEAPDRVPSSDSNSYARRFVRALLRPFAGTGLTPNAVTWLRIVTGLAACAACAIGAPLWNRWAALLWLASVFLDRGDGEFARLTGRCTEHGRRIDYWGDLVVNAAIFSAVGINLRHAALGHWSIPIGVAATLAIATASILAEALELGIGQKTMPSRHGFDLDDILFVLVPILWFGYLMPLLIGGLVGGLAATLYIHRRLAQLSPLHGGADGTAPDDLSQLPPPPLMS
jgi:putative membrane protein